MRVKFESDGNFENTVKWLEEASNKSPEQLMKKVGEEGVKALRENTPRGETGETANGWEYVIEKDRSGIEVSFINKAHPDAGVSIARIIDSGHGTGTGGYVPGQPYIKKSTSPIFEKASELIGKEMSE